MASDFYALLGVERTATPDEIKRAYRRKALEYHPDRNAGDKEKETLFKQINEAYSTLSDPQKRAHYDRFGTAEPAGGAGFGGFQADFSGMGFDFNDVFDSFFGGNRGGNGGGRRGSTKVRGESIEIPVSITFAETLSGIKKTIRYERMESCTDCKGSGSAGGKKPDTCPDCHGSGTVRQRIQTVFGMFEQMAACPRCGGTGQVISDPCKTCHGKKRTKKSVEREVEFPAGIADGMSLKLSGAGHEGVDGGSAGDLFLHVSAPTAHEGLSRESDHLRFRVDCSPAELALGGKKTIKIPLLGERVLEIAAGTQTSETLKFRGDGVKRLDRDAKGDLFVVLNVHIPTKLSKREKELYKELLEEGGHTPAKGFLSSLFGE